MVIAITIAVAVSFGQGIMFGPEATWVAELFATRLRYSGASLGFQIGAALSGGLTPMVASALLLWTGATWSISLYLIAIAVVTLAATLAAPETARSHLLKWGHAQ
jgi:MHS family shikimate/dehydroshikimate transporter-like MFS transporter